MSPDTAAVRPAAEADVPLLVELYGAAAAEKTSYRPEWPLVDARPEPVADSFVAELGRDTTAVLLRPPDGYAVVTLVPGLPQAPRSHARINDLYVTEAAREGASEQELFDAAVAWARRQGADSIDALVVAGDRHAKGRYERWGFKARLVHMHKTLA